MQKETKRMIQVIFTGLALFFLFMYQNNEPKVIEAPQEVEEEVSITLTAKDLTGDEDVDVIEKFEGSFPEGTILLDVMVGEFTVDEEQGFLSAIEGVSQDEDQGFWWVFDVNGEMAPVGANEYELKDGDVVEWKLTGFE